MMNLPTKFEVPNFTRFGNMKGDAKCRRWGRLGWLGVTQAYRLSPFDRVHTTSYSSLTEPIHLSCTVYDI